MFNRMKDTLSGIFLILFSVVTIYLAFKLPMGKIGRPGPGFFPFIISVIVGSLAILLVLRTLQSKRDSESEGIATARWKVFYLLGNLCLYAFLFGPLGFLISTWIFLIALKPIVKKGWIAVILGSLSISLSFFLFFNYLLKVELPMGILAK